ncbi:MAG: hypothetical protein BWY83_01165 [bacterium ADurb.Bin478]|nr:MAG: hypothetical protein BWY83_01165 [bacterium ADurb.Bin478]
MVAAPRMLEAPKPEPAGRALKSVRSMPPPYFFNSELRDVRSLPEKMPAAIRAALGKDSQSEGSVKSRNCSRSFTTALAPRSMELMRITGWRRTLAMTWIGY